VKGTGCVQVNQKRLGAIALENSIYAVTPKLLFVNLDF